MSVWDGGNSHHNCPCGPVFWICEQSSANNVWAVAERCLHSIKAFSISHSAPLSKWKKGKWSGVLAVGPGHPTRVQSLWETESQLHWVLGVTACAKDDHPVRYWKVLTYGKFFPQLLHTGLSSLFSPDLPSCPSWRGCEIYFLLSSETYLWLPQPFRSGKEFAMTADSCPSTTECTPSSLSCWLKWSLALLVTLYHD